MSDLEASRNWSRYEYARDRGHKDYIERALLCERYYLGGGEQWSEADRQKLEGEGRPAEEVNGIKPAVNTALGHQINNRMDVAFRPRGAGADQQKADVLAKVVRHVADRNHLPWLETQVYSDGLIQQRGYFDVRMEFDSNFLGSIQLSALDPLDVVPDPDAKGYEPKNWSDVLITRWYSLQDIERLYGKAKAQQVELSQPNDNDWGDTQGEERNKFGQNANNRHYDAWARDKDDVRVRVVERQYWLLGMQRVILTSDGDVFPVPDDWDDERVQAHVQATNGYLSKQMRRRVRWCVSTQDVLLQDCWSPYNHLTVVPFFPYFRRGKTRGMVDDAISPQRVLNKSISQYLHILNSMANSGWSVEEDSLVNMTVDELEESGAETGLIIEYKRGRQPPQKIQPNQVPPGVDRLIDRAAASIKEATGISDALQGLNGAEVSGIAIQSKQTMGQTQLAVPLDSLNRTRHMLAEILVALIQQYYTEPRILHITDTDDTGKEITVELPVNQPMSDGSVLNDLSLGVYDVVITEQPTQVTFEQNQFTQAMEMRNAGIRIPDDEVLRHSSLSRKHDIISRMQKDGKPEIDPLTEAKIELTKAQADKTRADSTSKAVEAQYSAIQTAHVITEAPATAMLADGLLKSAGFVDHDAAPIVPEYQGQPDGLAMAGNTHPTFPANPAVGMQQGLETTNLEGGN